MSNAPFASRPHDGVEEYTLCSVSSRNSTEDGLIGPGRIQNKFYGFLGRKLENAAGQIAEKVFHRGPQETGKDILTIHRNVFTVFWDGEAEYLAKIPKPHYLTSVRSIRKKCKRLERYVR